MYVLGFKCLKTKRQLKQAKLKGRVLCQLSATGRGESPQRSQTFTGSENH